MKKRSGRYFVIALIIAGIIIFFILNISRTDKGLLTGFISVIDFVLKPFSSISSVGSLFLDIIFQIDVTSPKNITYNFTRGENYTIDLNVSSNRNITEWKYTLRDARHNQIIYDSVLFAPNTTFNAVRWNNEFTISATDTKLNVKNTTVVFFVNINNSAPSIDRLDSEIFACENSYLSYFFNVTEIDEETPTATLSPQAPANPFYIAFSSSINLTKKRYEIFSGTLSKNDAGGSNKVSKTYAVNVSVSDNEFTDSNKTNITVIEVNNAPVITSIGVQTIWSRGDNSTFFKQVSVTDTEDGNQNSGNLTFNITFSGEGNLFNISSNGTMNFTANSSHLGVHNITVCASDLGLSNPHGNISLCNQNGTNLSSCSAFSLTVTNENRAPKIVSYYPTNLTFSVGEGLSIYFNMSEYDPDGTVPDAYWYVDDVLKEYDTNSLVDEFNYTFDYTSAGDHTIVGKITDGVLNESVQWNITVLDVTVAAPSVGAEGGVRRICSEKWGCEEWQQCKNLKKQYESGNISYELNLLIKENCSLYNWGGDICGFQTRKCTDLNLCKTNKTNPGVIRECYYTEFPSCDDGIKNCHDNSCEILVDCGGPCPICPTCSDGIKNGNELGIDCGGSCKPCAIEEIPYKDYIKKIVVFLAIILFLIAICLIILLTVRYHKKRKEVERFSRKG